MIVSSSARSYLSLVSTLALILLVPNGKVGVAADSEEKCPCLFEDEVLSEGCYVYGKNSIPWHLASSSCLADYDIDEKAVKDEELLWSACPYPNQTEHGLNAWINYLRDTAATDTVANDIRLQYFYWESLDGNVTTKLIDEYTTQPSGVDLNCVENPSFCWDDIKRYFDENPELVGEHCAELHYLQAEGLDREQQLVRQKICEQFTGTGDTIGSPPDECEPLVTQVEEESSGGTSCSDIGSGYDGAATDLPDCTEVLEPTQAPTSSAAVGRISSFVLALVTASFI